METVDLCNSISDPKSRMNEQIRADAKVYGIWCNNNICICRESDTAGDSRFVGSRRVFYNMAIYDGLDAGFLDNWSFDTDVP